MRITAVIINSPFNKRPEYANSVGGEMRTKVRPVLIAILLTACSAMPSVREMVGERYLALSDFEFTALPKKNSHAPIPLLGRIIVGSDSLQARRQEGRLGQWVSFAPAENPHGPIKPKGIIGAPGPQIDYSLALDAFSRSVPLDDGRAMRLTLGAQTKVRLRETKVIDLDMADFDYVLGLADTYSRPVGGFDVPCYFVDRVLAADVTRQVDVGAQLSSDAGASGGGFQSLYEGFGLILGARVCRLIRPEDPPIDKPVRTSWLSDGTVQVAFDVAGMLQMAQRLECDQGGNVAISHSNAVFLDPKAAPITTLRYVAVGANRACAVKCTVEIDNQDEVHVNTEVFMVAWQALTPEQAALEAISDREKNQLVATIVENVRQRSRTLQRFTIQRLGKLGPNLEPAEQHGNYDREIQKAVEELGAVVKTLEGTNAGPPQEQRNEVQRVIAFANGVMANASGEYESAWRAFSELIVSPRDAARRLEHIAEERTRALEELLGYAESALGLSQWTHAIDALTIYVNEDRYAPHRIYHMLAMALANRAQQALNTGSIAYGDVTRVISILAEHSPVLGPEVAFEFRAGDDGLPRNWMFKVKHPRGGLPVSTLRRRIDVGKSGTLSLRSEGESFAFYRGAFVEPQTLQEYRLVWEWRMTRVPETMTHEEVRNSETADVGVNNGLCLLVGFVKTPKDVRVLHYAWNLREHEGLVERTGEVINSDSPWMPNITMTYPNIVAQSGPATDDWMMEERNVFEDYRAAFGEDPPRMMLLGVQTNSQYGPSEAIGSVRNIRLLARD